MNINYNNSKHFNKISPGEVFFCRDIDNIYIKTKEITTPSGTFNALDVYNGGHFYFEPDICVSLIPNARLEIF